MSLDIACKDSICALSTPPGHGALAIVRLSGPKSLEIFSSLFKKHRGEITIAKAMHGVVIDSNSKPIDDVMALLFAGKNSFTGEDSAEIHCHGNPLIVDQILRRMCELGARLAEPGEFSMRAMLHGKIDLAQAESIADLIHAETKVAQEAALHGVQGGLRQRTKAVEDMLISVLAEIEARMDFPDEDLGGYDISHLLTAIDEGRERLKQLIASAFYSVKLHEGARLVLCGVPNAGKSTLLNHLSGEEKAIVHNQAGTTRDVIEAKISLEGIPVTLVDVAGIREVGDENEVEKIGIAKAMLEIERAHGVIWLADGTAPEPFSDAVIKEKLATLRVPVLQVVNKVDAASPSSEFLSISAKYGHGIDALKAELRALVVGEQAIPKELFITRARQRDELIEACQALEHAYEALKAGMVDEVITSELRVCGQAFERLFGVDVSESVLDKIFSQFCIGK